MTAVVVAAYAFVVTFLILKIINIFGPVRVPDSVELKGLDETEFGETAYDLDYEIAGARPSAARPQVGSGRHGLSPPGEPASVGVVDVDSHGAGSRKGPRPLFVAHLPCVPALVSPANRGQSRRAETSMKLLVSGQFAG